MVVAIVSGFALAVIAPWLQRVARAWAGWLLALLPAGLAVYFALQAPAIAQGQAVSVSYAWVPSLGVQLSLYMDGWGLLFALLISGIGALVVIYAGAYLAGHPQLGRFYAYILMFMASMLGVVLSDNVIALFVFWELTSLTSYLLIGFDHQRAAARAGALQALLVTAGGGLALLVGLLILGQVGGSLELSQLFERGAVVRSHGLYPAIMVLVLLGAFAKSAQVPFHFWLPNAMEAPTPVSAYLHSATMVKAGVYLLGRLSPVLGGTDVWLYALAGVGAATMLVGALLALRQRDLKRILAYTTISALGTLVLLLGIGTPLAVKAAVVFLAGHALYKGALFLIAGALDHETGTRDVVQLGGLRHAMPMTAAAAGLAFLSAAGLPPTFAFMAKEMQLEALLHAPQLAAVVTAIAVLVSTMLVTVSIVVAVGPFTGEKTTTPKKPHEAPLGMWLGPLVLAGTGLLLGLWPAVAQAPLLSPAATAILAEPVKIGLYLWHGWTPALAFSIVAWGVGVLAYSRRQSIRTALAPLDRAASWGPERVYGLVLDGLNALARGQTRLLQSGYLRYYLMTIIGTSTGLAAFALVGRGGLTWQPAWQEVQIMEIAIVVLILMAAFVAMRSQSRLGAVASLGVVGYGVALIFILFGAPDLAMTQFMIETLTVILLVLVFYHLPRFARLSTRRARVRDAVVALAAGALVTAFLLVAPVGRSYPPISDYFAEHSLPDGHGRNVVNVIIVDFRALDTLGEITVLSLAGVGVLALLKLKATRGHDK